MDSTNNNTENIDAYLLGRLKGRALADFEAKLTKDTGLQEAVANQQQILKGLTTYGNQQLRERLSRIRQQQKESTPQPQRASRRSIFRLLTAAAAVALLLIVANLWWNNTATTDAFADFYQPYELTTGSRSTASDSQLIAIGQLYSNGRFAEALPEMKAYLSEHPNSLKIQLAAAISHIELQQEATAISYLNAIIATDDPFFTDHARWYKALCLIKLDRSSEAQALLQQLASDADADHHNDAVALLKEL